MIVLQLHLDANDWSAATLGHLAAALDSNATLELLTLRSISVSPKDLMTFVLSLSDNIALKRLVRVSIATVGCYKSHTWNSVY